jgi:YidC/Oxa1 family membrane protein insertase
MTPLALIAPIQAIVDLLQPVLVFFHDTVGVGWGMSIVLLTVCIRALLTPLMVKQFKSMKAMIAYAPQIKAVQEKYKDDKERQRQEVMKVYQENKINPFASCLPILMQLPFFIGLFYLLQSDLRREICGVGTSPCGEVANPTDPGAEKFLFIPDLTDKATGTVLVVLIVLYISSQLLSSVLTPSTGDRNAKMLMYGLPFVFTFFIINFPAGLIVYWITTNLWTVGQGYILRKRLGPIKPVTDDVPAPVKAEEDEGVRKGLMARLMEATAKQPVSTAAKEPAAVGAKSGGASAKSAAGTSAKSGGATAKKPAPAPKPARSGPPPKPPRKKKKRSGRRR